MPSITSIGIAEYENANIALPLLSDELKLLEGYGPEWEQLSKREKLHKQWEQFDSIACGALGKWQLLDLKERKEGYKARQKGRASSLATHASSALSVTSRSLHSHSSSNGSGSERGGSGTEDEAAALEFKRRSVVDRSESRGRRDKPTPLNIRRSSEEPLIEVAESPVVFPQTRTRQSSVSTVMSRHTRVASLSQTRDGADSSVSLSTLSRAKSHAALKSPSVVTASRDSSVGMGNRKVSSTASSVTAVERAQPVQATTGASALASLMAAQAKLAPERQTVAKPSAANTVTNWLWGRKAKPPASQASKAATNTGISSLSGQTTSKVITTAMAKESNLAGTRESTSSGLARNPSLLSMKRPVTSLSVTPATPAPATTSSVQTAPSNQTQPVVMGNPNGARRNAADVLSDPRSLEESSLQQYFLEAARQNAIGTKNLQSTIEKEKSKRLARLNPSNPSRVSGQLKDQSRRWLNIFPRAGRVNNQRSVKWKSMCTPACLPLYSDYIPSIQELSHSYVKDTYSLPVTMDMSSFLLRSGKSVTETAGNLLREMISQRLAQSFQIILPAYGDPAGTGASRAQGGGAESWDLPTAEEVRQILFNTTSGAGKPIFLGFSNTVHRLRFDQSSACITVTSWKERVDWRAKPVDYTFMLWPVGSDSFQTSAVKFAYPDLTNYDWKYMDRLVAGLEESKLQEKTRYWRTRFALIPAEVPDLQGMIQSQSKVLLEDSTEDDLRIAGVMTLYEQFSKARWQAKPKEKSKTQL
jgi:hypothetical protein